MNQSFLALLGGITTQRGIASPATAMSGFED